MLVTSVMEVTFLTSEQAHLEKRLLGNLLWGPSITGRGRRHDLKNTISRIVHTSMVEMMA